MSNLTNFEKRKFEQLLGMDTGYVLDFTNRSFAEFVLDSTGRDITIAATTTEADRRRIGCGHIGTRKKMPWSESS